EVIKYLDVIVDGPFMIDKKNNQAKWKGSDNQRVIDVKRTISEGGIHEHTT
ncbi:MAG TPA: anaerobic ribonucleoside-triphosphate reductase activating protein, partial [Lachnospiraceae bacterium]|nr:anaerobic ribonucleoside-triphosphate reductase activating protein [Lachnospiraceae bacterium]